jgi:hypothetical protein
MTETEPRYVREWRERQAARAKLGLVAQISAGLSESPDHYSRIDEFASRGKWHLRLTLLYVVPIAAVGQLPALWRGFVAGWRAGGR